MTLHEQLQDISNRWINEDFTRVIPMPRILEALAKKAFMKTMEEDIQNNWHEFEAIYAALQLLEKAELGMAHTMPAFIPISQRPLIPE